MPAETTARIVGAANAQARRHTLIALGGSLALVGRAQVWAWWRARRRAAANRRFA